jgi:hypothetical protein
MRAAGGLFDDDQKSFQAIPVVEASGSEGLQPSSADEKMLRVLLPGIIQAAHRRDLQPHRRN